MEAPARTLGFAALLALCWAALGLWTLFTGRELLGALQIALAAGFLASGVSRARRQVRSGASSASTR